MKDSKNLVIGLLCAVVCIMAVAYAAFSTTLTINGTAGVTSDWNVAIDSIDCEVNEVSGGQTSADAAVYKVEGTTAQFTMKFYQPGDTGTCTVTIANTGSIPAKVADNGVVVTVKDGTGAATTESADAIVYSLSGIEPGDTLAAKGTNTYTIELEYVDVDADNDGNSDTLTEAQSSKTVTVSIEYVQDFDAA